MAYTDFTLTKVKQQFGLTVNESQHLFAQVNAVQPSEFLALTLRGCFKSIKALYACPQPPNFWGTFEPILLQSPPKLGDLGGRFVSQHILLKHPLREYLPLATAINTKKARSELLIAPVLTEIRRQLKNQMSFFSGTEFNVDGDRGLQGFCDCMLSRSPEQFDITAPVVIIVEAKNESIKGELGQCIASMLAAQTFNQNAGNDIDVIYGAVTSGTDWRFLTLSGSLVYIDLNEYFINEVDKILGILLQPFQPALAIL